MDIYSDRIRLNAKLELPASGSTPCPLAIIIHGITGHMEEEHIVSVARTLRDEGLATLRVDMYGHGHSDGQFRNQTLFKWITNALSVIDYAKGLDFVTDLYLCGHSQGGLTVALTAALKRNDLKGIIELSPALMVPDCARNGNFLGTVFDPEHIPDEVGQGKYALDGNYFRVAQTFHVNEFIDRYTGPVFLVHGDQDQAVPVQYSIDAAQRYRQAELAIIPGDDHNYTRHLDQALSAVQHWIRKQLEVRNV